MTVPSGSVASWVVDTRAGDSQVVADILAAEGQSPAAVEVDILAGVGDSLAVGRRAAVGSCTCPFLAQRRSTCTWALLGSRSSSFIRQLRPCYSAKEGAWAVKPAPAVRSALSPRAAY